MYYAFLEILLQISKLVNQCFFTFLSPSTSEDAKVILLFGLAWLSYNGKDGETHDFGQYCLEKSMGDYTKHCFWMLYNRYHLNVLCTHMLLEISFLGKNNGRYVVSEETRIINIFGAVVQVVIYFTGGIYQMNFLSFHKKAQLRRVIAEDWRLEEASLYSLTESEIEIHPYLKTALRELRTTGKNLQQHNEEKSKTA